jgi:hypothetical protein
MDDPSFLRTGLTEFDEAIPRIEAFLRQDTLDLVIDGRAIRGYRSPDAKSVWIRDYSDMIRGFKYFEPEVQSVVEHFAETQGANGRIFDYFTTHPEKLPGERENWTKYVRVPVEADVEFRFVKAAHQAWQATGDDAWIAGILPHLERALDYATSHRWRWDEKRGLVKRAYTIDTWDFAYTAGRHDWLQFQIDDDTFWGILHGDNSGYCEAFRLTAAIHAHLGDAARARHWLDRADELQRRLNEHCWNGSFYTHFVKINPVEIAGVDEARQLSLSNPMAINRGVCDHSQAVSILREYQARGKSSGAFAEWFSIDPPFPDGVFGDELLKAGAYCNGGIMPLVGGELARAAFEHGFEEYGVDILRRYHRLIAESNASHLWYHPDGTPSSEDTSTSPDALPTDGWGSSAMLHALVEGLIGVVDQATSFRRLRLAPRWPAAGIDEAHARIAYAASGAEVEYLWKLSGDELRLEILHAEAEVEFHLLLPAGRSARSVTIDGAALSFDSRSIESSRYADFRSPVTAGTVVRLLLE